MPAQAAGEGDCQKAGIYNDWAGINYYTGDFPTVRGIRSYVFQRDRLAMCDGVDSIHGPSYWVSLVPAPDNQYYGAEHAIMQIGVVTCDLLASQVCDRTPNIFAAIGGCGNYEPQPVFLANAPAGGITFAVRRVTGGNFWLTAVQNGMTIADTYVAGTNPATSCWASGTGDNVIGQLACERWDPGDNCGSTSGTILFDDIRHQKAVDGTWYAPGQTNSGKSVLTDSACFETHVELHCDVYTTDAFRTWAVQQ